MPEIDLGKIMLTDEGAAAAEDLPFLSTEKIAQSEEWQAGEGDGQLSVDVLDNGDELVVIALMAGAKPGDIEMHLHNDFLTIRGQRSSPELQPANYFYQECYWGKFSRTIVLPVDVRGEMVRSEYQSGVLTIHLPKAKASGAIPIVVIED